MKKVNEKIKNLFQEEVNLDLLKLGGTLVAYIIIFSIFYAGYEFRNVSAIKNREQREKIKEYKYYITYKGDQDQYNYNEPKELLSLIDNIDNMELDITEYYEGKLLKAIGGNPNFKIYVNGNLVESNFFESRQKPLDSNTKIEIIN